MCVFAAIIDVWSGKSVEETVEKYKSEVADLPGYNLEYILYDLKWILDQEDVNFTGRPERKQKQLDEILSKAGVKVPRGRAGSQLAISLLRHYVGQAFS